MNFKNIITLEPGKRGGKPCIRGLRMTVYDVLEYLSSGMSQQEILDDFPYLTKDDILQHAQAAVLGGGFSVNSAPPAGCFAKNPEVCALRLLQPLQILKSFKPDPPKNSRTMEFLNMLKPPSSAAGTPP